MAETLNERTARVLAQAQEVLARYASKDGSDIYAQYCGHTIGFGNLALDESKARRTVEVTVPDRLREAWVIALEAMLLGAGGTHVSSTEGTVEEIQAAATIAVLSQPGPRYLLTATEVTSAMPFMYTTGDERDLEEAQDYLSPLGFARLKARLPEITEVAVILGKAHRKTGGDRGGPGDQAELDAMEYHSIWFLI